MFHAHAFQTGGNPEVLLDLQSDPPVGRLSSDSASSSSAMPPIFSLSGLESCLVVKYKAGSSLGLRILSK
jgi:hypothetical protein